MTDHYYSKNPSVSSKPMNWTYTLRGFNFDFKTDRGVFSKGEVDFGSRLLIESFNEPTIDGPLLDVGCGYGPIGLALAKVFPQRQVHMIDVNERAVELATENSVKNHIKNTKIFASDMFENVQEKGYAAILTNPPIRAGKKTVFSILETSFRYLQTGGELWVVIQKKQGAPSVKKKLEELFGEVEIVKKDKGYYILNAKKID
jgi:16S rRNA (guanine1207-N2)-methyltransferase